MCGIFGLVGPDLPPDDDLVIGLRDLMSHRGPDGAGLWRGPGIALAHRRLAVVDPSPGGAQPMVLPDGSALVYNGELYNDAEVRRELAGRGVAFETTSDAETVLRALSTWGRSAFARLRGMFALAFFDGPCRRLTLARDPLGIKPLYYRLGPVAGRMRLVFASDPRTILAHPGVEVRPDLATVSGYLTTIRTTLGSRTLFEGISTLRPGEVVVFDTHGEAPRIVSRAVVSISQAAATADKPPRDLRTVIEESVNRHLRSDVPLCCLLSGGLDSSIIASVARRSVPELWTYCAGELRAPEGGGLGQSEDFAFARRMAAQLGTRHTEVGVSREIFAARWPSMVGALGVPLSTPNEVAIFEVAQRLRSDGQIVALSGEGADELFGGYELPMRQAAEFAAGRPSIREGGRFQLDSAAWVPLGAKAAILNPEFARAIEGDAALIETYEDEFSAASAERDDPDPLQAHLRFCRRINLSGLLGRLDTATMLAGVEGRTPFADVVVAGVAEALPMDCKFSPGPPVRTKAALREAFGADLPPEVIARPKASFPLPFQEWVADNTGALRQSEFARALFTEAAIANIIARPADLWQFAWPMVNLAIWGRRWWG
jgi:asparagine synthase (glutamine-hydrolysing)